MALTTGRVAAEALNDGEEKLLYTVPASPQGSANKNFSICSISVCNRGNSAEGVSIAVVPQGAALNDSYWIEYRTLLLSHGVIERTGITLQEGDSIYAKAHGANLSAVVFAVFTGLEAPPVNLLENGGFENDFAFWDLSGADAQGVFNGVASITATDPATLTRTDSAILTVGETYLISVDIANVTDTGLQVFDLTVTDGAGGTYVVGLDLTQDYTVPITQEFTATTGDLTVVLEIAETTVQLNSVGVFLQ